MTDTTDTGLWDGAINDRAPPGDTYSPPPATSWRSRFRRTPAERRQTAEIIAFPRERIVRQPPNAWRPRVGERVSFNYQSEPGLYIGTVTDIAVDDTGAFYAIRCDDGITRGLAVPS